MPSGRVKFFNTDRGFGFILPDDGGPDVFVHVHEVETAGMNTLVAGQLLAYDIGTARDGAVACLSPVICEWGTPSWKLETNFNEFSTYSDAEPVIGGVVCVSVVVTPRGILLVVHMANDRHRNHNDGCADD
jgi:CspA family cold shock protein